VTSRAPSAALPGADTVRDLRRRLLAWYRRHARAMPWRETRDPWRIWVSEVMLQQTQVATATPYYLSFVERFPTVSDLARAPESEVLRAWAGLGYYRRARHLHAAARTVVREHGAHVPGDPAAFAALPGVGRYTAGAVLSIAFGRPLPVLDGNVARVLARLFALRLGVRESAGAKRLWEIATGLVPMRSPGDWNQALMELGATVCLPRAPRCGACPLASHCRARGMGRPEDYPVAAKRRPAIRVRRAVALIRRGRQLLVRRLSGALLEGLWEPPGVELADGAPARRALAAHLGELGLAARLWDSGRRVRHTITHRAIEVEMWEGSARGRVPRGPALRWVDPEAPAVALTALTRKLARQAPRRERPEARPAARRPAKIALKPARQARR
jgi:A/G-specific adenine glycosylase